MSSENDLRDIVTKLGKEVRKLEEEVVSCFKNEESMYIISSAKMGMMMDHGLNSTHTEKDRMDFMARYVAYLVELAA